MAVIKLDIETFLTLRTIYPVIDVRSEGEYAHAHIPAAISMPLFNNEERKIIGTAYKQQSKQTAIKIGLASFGGKMVEMIETVEQILRGFQASKTIIVHCWRGGMRSGAVAWLLDLYGYKVYTIIGGYKSFRKWALQQFEKDYPLKVLGGYTGSGKTYVLEAIKKIGENVIDLEGIAKHKGSAFGSIGMPAQPSQEMFENFLSLELWVSLQKETPIWVEDESQRIGLVNIPTPFFAMMRKKPVYFLDIPFEERLKHITSCYGKADKEILKNATLRIQKRLGGLETKNALAFLEENNISEAFAILLKYYDKQYLKGLHNRETLEGLLTNIPSKTVDANKNAAIVVAKKLNKLHA